MKKKIVIGSIGVIVIILLVVGICLFINNSVKDDKNDIIQDEIQVNDEITAYDFKIEYNESTNRWRVVFDVNRINGDFSNNYAKDYTIYFYGKNNKILYQNSALIFDNLSMGKTTCVIDVEFDAHLIESIAIKKVNDEELIIPALN